MSRPHVSYDDLSDAFEVASFAGTIESAAYLCKLTGAIYLDCDGFDEELPDDLDDNEQYLQLPTKLELDLGRSLALRFAAKHLPDDYETVRDYFRKEGAYARFKDLLSRRSALEAWREYEAAAIREELVKWCSENGIEIDAQHEVEADEGTCRPN